MTDASAPAQNRDADLSRREGHPGPGGRGGGGLSILDLLIVIAERKRMIFGITVFFALASVVIALLLPTRYTASVTLMPPQEGSSPGSALASQVGNLPGIAMVGNTLNIKNPNDRYASLLESRTVEDAMVQHFGLMQEYHAKKLSEARAALEGNVVVDVAGKDGLIRIYVEDRDPQRAAELANGFVDQFRNLSQHLAITEASQRRLFFEEELAQNRDKLADAEDALKRTEKSTGVIQPDSQEKDLIQSVAALRAQITAKEVEIHGIQTYATGQNPQLAIAQRELDALRAQLAKLGGVGSSANQAIIPQSSVTDAGMEYSHRLRDVKYYEAILDILARQYESAKLDEAKQGALIQTVDPAIPPDKKSSPKRARIVLIATGIGLFLGALIALVQGVFQYLRSDPNATEQLGLLRRAFSMRNS